MKVLAPSLALWLAMTLGCEKKAEHAKSGSTPAAQKDAHGHDAGSREGHEHHAGDKYELAATKVGEFEVSATYSGSITPGKEVDVDLALKDECGKVAAIRSRAPGDAQRGPARHNRHQSNGCLRRRLSSSVRM